MRKLEGSRIPGFLQKIQWLTDPLGYLDNAAEKFPNLFKTQISPLGKYQVLVSHPKAVQQIFIKESKGEFTIPPAAIMRPFLGNESLFMQEGNRHKSQRKLLMPPFHGERMRSYGQIICDLTEKTISQLPLNKTFSAHGIMQDISLQVILKTVFGLHEGECYQHLEQLLVSWLSLLKSPLFNSHLLFSSLQKDLGPWSPWGDFLRKRQQINKFLYAEISARRANLNPERTDILTLLLSARHEDGKPMTDVELRDQLITLLAAGHETTATAMTWSLYWVHRHPEIKDKLLKEISGLGNSPDPMSIFQAPYLTAVCQEALRLYPVVPFTKPRMLKSQSELMGYELQPGTIVQGCIYLIHHREDLYSYAKQFKPERFLERQFSPYEFLPFGGGSHRCIGEALAMFEMKLVLATILSGYQLTLTDDKPLKPVPSGITLVPPGGVSMVMLGQRQPQQISLPVANPV